MKSSAIIGRVGTLAVVLGVGAAISGVTGIAQADNPKHNDRNSSASSDNRPGNSRAERRAARAAGSGQDKGADASGNQDSGQGRSPRTPKAKTTPSAATGDTDSTSPDPRPRLGERLRTITGSLTGSAPSTVAPKTTTRTVEESAPAAQPETRAPRSKLRGPFAGVQEAVANIPAVVAKTPAQLVDRSASGLGATPITRPDAADVPTRSNNRRSITDVAARLAAAATPAVTMATGRAAEVPALSRATLAKAENAVDAQSAPWRRLAAIADKNVSGGKNTVGDKTVFGDKTLSNSPAPVQAFVANATGALDTSANIAVGDAPAVKPGAAATLVSSLMVAAGLSPLAGGGPAAPTQSPLAWALAAWTRKEADKDIDADGVQLKSAADGESVETGAEPPATTPTVEVPVMLMAAVTSTDTQASTDPAVLTPGQTEKPVITGSLTSDQVGWTTGPNTDTQHNWYVGGTDLGIMWDSGYTADGKPIVYSLFGDTFNSGTPDNNTGGWRNNVLLRSSDINLTNGMTFDDAVISPGGIYQNNTWWNPITGPVVTDNPDGNRAGATQVIKDPGGLPGTTYTMIPTSAIAIQKKDPITGEPVVDANNDPVMTQYATVMSIKKWGQAGSWTTNWSAIAVSTDGGKTWKVDKNTVRYSSQDPNFQQNAMVKGNPDDPTSWTGGAKGVGEQYVYVYGTPAGRQGSAYVARVPESDITDLSKYQYFAGDNGDGTGTWASKPSDAVAVIGTEGATGTIFPTTGILGTIMKPLVSFLKLVYPAGFKPGGIFSAGGTGGNVSEMSVQYNEYLEKYVVMYTDGGNNVVMRVSDSPQGTWSDATVVQANAGSGQNTGMYAPMIHPLSGTGQLDGDDSNLYYNLSQWGDYNVRMMKTDLSKITVT